MADQLDDLPRRLDDTMADVNSTKLVGLFADWFNERGLVLEAEVRNTATILRDDADSLRSHTRTSEASVAARDESIASWRDALGAHDNWEE